MAVKTLRSWAVALMILTVGLLLFGCAENRQTVSNPLERSDFSGTGADNSGQNKDTVADRPEAAGIQPEGGPEDGAKKQQESTKDTGVSSVSGPQPDSINSTQTETPSNHEDLPDKDSNERKIEQEKSREASTGEISAAPAAGNTPAAPEEKEPDKTDENQPAEIKFSEMYSGGSSRGLKFSDKLTNLNGKKVIMSGYMAPPLKPSFTFFVLTREPMAICPFCSSDASWPEDIILTYLPEGKEITPGNSVFRVTGTLELGSHTDPDTGFVSQVRIYADKIETIQ